MIRTDDGASGARHNAFIAVAVAFLVFLYLFSPFTQVFLGWFVDFDDNISHRVHEVTFGVLFSMIFVGVFAQLREPTRQFAAVVQAVVAAVGLSVIITLTTGWEWPTLLFIVPLAAIVWLHPQRNDFFRYRLQPNRAAVIMMLLITAPLLDAIAVEFDKAANEVRGHQSHWAGMAAFALTLLVVGFLAALRVHGWPLLTWSVGLSLGTYGVLSLVYRFDASARPDARAVLAIIWSVVWIALAKLARPVPASTRLDEAVLRDRASVWRRVAAIAVGVFLVLLGMAVSEIARGVIEPPIPHTLTALSTQSCLECHATGQINAPVIDWRTHNNYESVPRSIPETCIGCHDWDKDALVEATARNPVPPPVVEIAATEYRAIADLVTQLAGLREGDR